MNGANLLTLWLFIMLVLAWAFVFVILPIWGAMALSEHLGALGKVGLGAVGVLIYFPTVIAVALWLTEKWAVWAVWT